ncbi:prolipoprotein diacylglyceryl transferase [Salisediminibacterium halotolerans]|uniref:prolipoprotein diacylglyceryl transferase n=1 Tax=Salisediminibacterium halotolerans TaxID=517425 RepID=UPI000EAF8DDD|nr:prolipoprotein diacylglyceryl transferase [Salisediminibacterium halotolerans]RLJ75465.1 phosphatidylglycerol:prolipoprotein diacylglycerol transferase [Actinophytocola xinjiangensis]RPE89318.1 prolipoprotein diacylglyceryl transferase [Salisediminibacterium halotolerans]TWG36078.1 prolipoprotein diacylglyceryl transferase [Salisediminibacterium halotolerans]GEL07841.1 prolipoprotein diacylglyceryl transferase [Salisediminibacterium halotolerans]
MITATAQPLNPIAFELGPLTVHWYGLIIGIGAVLGYLLAQSEAKKRGLPEDTLADLLLFALPLAILGARLYYVIFSWENYADQPVRALYIWEGGLAIHGGLIASAITAIVFARKKGLSFWKIADITAPSILLGQAVGRWGNFINQEAYGGEVSRGFLESLFLPEFIIEQMFINGAYHHPTFLYESLWNLAGVALLLYLRKVNMRQGELFITYMIWYSFGRFFIEGLRTDSLMLFDVIQVAQLISLVAIAGGMALLVYRRKTGMSNRRYLDAEPQKTNVKKSKS